MEVNCWRIRYEDFKWLWSFFLMTPQYIVEKFRSLKGQVILNVGDPRQVSYIRTDDSILKVLLMTQKSFWTFFHHLHATHWSFPQSAWDSLLFIYSHCILPTEWPFCTQPSVHQCAWTQPTETCFHTSWHLFQPMQFPSAVCKTRSLCYRHHSSSFELKRIPGRSWSVRLIYKYRSNLPVTAFGSGSLEPNHVVKTPEIGGEYGKRWGWVGGGTLSVKILSLMSVCLSYLLSSVYSSFKGTVTSSESIDDSSIVFNEL